MTADQQYLALVLALHPHPPCTQSTHVWKHYSVCWECWHCHYQPPAGSVVKIGWSTVYGGYQDTLVLVE